MTRVDQVRLGFKQLLSTNERQIESSKHFPLIQK